MHRSPDRHGAGFTIIELVVVIVVIGILAATALPRFVDITGDAHDATVEAIGASLRSGVGLTHASWLAKGASASVNATTVEGGGTVGMTDSGWPQNTASGGGDGTPTATECVALFQQLLSNAPAITSTAGSGDWTASVVSSTTCRYTYNGAAGRRVDYDVSDGSVSIVVP